MGRGLWLDRTATIGAAVLALVTLGLVALGLGVPINGGLLRFTPYATLVVAPLTVALVVVRPWYGLCLWILLIPIMNVAQVQVFLGPEQVILTTVFILALLLGSALRRRSEASKGAVMQAERTTRIIWASVAVIALLTLISTALTPSLTRSLPIAQHGLLEPLLLLAAVLWLRPNMHQLFLLLVSMGASVAIGAGLSLTRMLLRYAQSLDQFQAERAQLAKLVYFNVGILGDMLAMALPLLVAWLMLRHNGRYPRLTLAIADAAIAVSVVCLYLTFSKSGWLGGIIGCAALLIVMAHRWRVRFAVGLIAMVLISFVIPFPSFILRAISPAAATAYGNVVNSIDSRAVSIDPGSPEGEVSVTERVLSTKTAIRMALDHPWLGVGPGSFAAEYANAYHVAAATRALDSAHDFLPYVAAEFGLIVAALVALGLAAALVRASLTFLRAPPGEMRTRVVAAAVAAAIGAFIVVSTTFGVDLYRPYRTMNSDVLFAALLVAAGIMLPRVAGEANPLNTTRPRIA